MILHDLFRSLELRVVAGCLLLVNWSGSASAQDWDFRYRQNQVVAAPLQVLPDAYSDETCPEYFRPARLSAEIDLDQAGSIFVEPFFPLISRTAGTGRLARMPEDHSAAFDMQVDLIGCVFQRHFLPLKGQVILSGDFVLGRIEKAEFFYPPGRDYESFKSYYFARLSGPASGFAIGRIEAAQSLSEDHVMGTLTLSFPRLQLPLISDGSAGEVAHISGLHLKILVLSGEVAE